MRCRSPGGTPGIVGWRLSRDVDEKLLPGVCGESSNSGRVLEPLEYAMLVWSSSQNLNLRIDMRGQGETGRNAKGKSGKEPERSPAKWDVGL